jgi:5-methylcytosine-specific restriction enzyme A
VSRPDLRSATAEAYRKLYTTPKWKAFRLAYLAEHPLCERCLIQEIVTEATVVHHAEAHRGDVDKFWEAPFEAVCKPHHDSHGQREDLGQELLSFDAQGWPT